MDRNRDRQREMRTGRSDIMLSFISFRFSRHICSLFFRQEAQSRPNENLKNMRTLGTNGDRDWGRDHLSGRKTRRSHIMLCFVIFGFPPVIYVLFSARKPRGACFQTQTSADVRNKRDGPAQIMPSFISSHFDVLFEASSHMQSIGKAFPPKPSTSIQTGKENQREMKTHRLQISLYIHCLLVSTSFFFFFFFFFFLFCSDHKGLERHKDQNPLFSYISIQLSPVFCLIAGYHLSKSKQKKGHTDQTPWYIS